MPDAIKPKGDAPRPSAADRLNSLESVDITVDQLVAGGDGLGRFEGIPIFVPRSAPGDHLRVRLTECKSGYGRGEILEILSPGPGRRKPPCAHFDDCGGCDLQHLEDAHQTKLKVEALRETLARLGGLRDLPRIRVRASKPWAYRLRTQLHCEGEGKDLRIGYRARKSHRLVPVEACPILVPALQQLLPKLPSTLEKTKAPRRVDLAVGDDGGVTSAPVIEGLPHGEVVVTEGEHSYAFDARCFFQGHRGLLSALLEETVGPWTGENAFDLYAGVGLFSLPLAKRYERVVSVEGDRLASRYGRTNARRNRLGQIEVQAKSVEGWIQHLPAGASRVVLDPPRAGLSPKVRVAILKQRPQRLTYVSCHPATLARDLRSLTRGFHLTHLSALDLFPQTGHLEAVAQLERSETEVYPGPP
ncbi:MAG: class I SAM-dependent RNA methyltransferase [Deltaproteobacteria bacterium]|nr:class I SAM-dependent RNA methyltransferase [Deltaproteobacteria bacterium]